MSNNAGFASICIHGKRETDVNAWAVDLAKWMTTKFGAGDPRATRRRSKKMQELEKRGQTPAEFIHWAEVQAAIRTAARAAGGTH